MLLRRITKRHDNKCLVFQVLFQSFLSQTALATVFKDGELPGENVSVIWKQTWSLASTQPQILKNISTALITRLWSGFDYWSTPFLSPHCRTQGVSKFLGHCHQYRSFSRWICCTDSTNFQLTVNYSYDTRGNELLVVSHRLCTKWIW